MVFVVAFLACVIAGEALQPRTGDVSRVLSDLRWQSEQEKALRSEIQYAVRRLAAGGSQAVSAAARLAKLSSLPNGKTMMKAAGVEGTAKDLMQKPSSSTTLQRLAGSLLTIMTGTPVASSLSDTATGSAGRVQVVLPRPSRVYGPDAVIARLDAGIPPES